MTESNSSINDPSPVTNAVRSWSDVSRHVTNSYLEANRAVLAGFGLSTSTEREGATAPAVDSVLYGSADWTTERSVESREELGVGEYVEFSKLITDDDVHAFAEASGDTNRLHLDDGFASRARFGGRIIHGTLVAGLISAALARLPGLTIYLSENLEFRAPAEIGSILSARCEIVEDLGDEKYRLTAQVTDTDETMLIDGEAVVLIDELPE